jgi:hypothetical protein
MLVRRASASSPSRKEKIVYKYDYNQRIPSKFLGKEKVFRADRW